MRNLEAFEQDSATADTFAIATRYRHAVRSAMNAAETAFATSHMRTTHLYPATTSEAARIPRSRIQSARSHAQATGLKTWSMIVGPDCGRAAGGTTGWTVERQGTRRLRRMSQRSCLRLPALRVWLRRHRRLHRCELSQRPVQCPRKPAGQRRPRHRRLAAIPRQSLLLPLCLSLSFSPHFWACYSGGGEGRRSVEALL